MLGATDWASRWPALDIASKRTRLSNTLRLFPGFPAGAVEADSRMAERAAAALTRRDASFWSRDTDTQRRIADRLGWIDSPGLMADSIPALRTFAERVVTDRFTHIVLLGMGGSSLAPEVLRAVLGVAPGRPAFHVLDSTDPAAVRAAATPPEGTLYVLASKSGTTIELIALAAHFRARLEHHGQHWADHAVVITDEGTELARRARAERFREVFINPPDVGGRYSALSYFGLVPAVLMGQDLDTLVGWSLAMLAASRSIAPGGTEPAIQLGLALGRAARAGRDKLTLLMPPALEPFGLWVEQLIAESTGKGGTGIVPIAGEQVTDASRYDTDRVFVGLRLAGSPTRSLETRLEELKAAGRPVVEIEWPELGAIGGEFVRWEIAAAVVGAVLEINPFDEPNVQQAKDATRTLLDGYRSAGRLPSLAPDGTLPDGIRLVLTTRARQQLGGRHAASILALAGRGDYVALLAYLPPDAALASELCSLRTAIHDRTGVATMLGYGPRYLHSTGQLHKGGPNTGVFIVVTADPTNDVPIPGETFTFGTLELAQAIGDFMALDAAARRAVHVHLSSPDPRLLRVFGEALRADGPGAGRLHVGWTSVQ